jgi:hypothetical protein
MQNQIPKDFFGNLCRTEYRKTFSVIYAETINRKTFSVIYLETINRKTFSVNGLCTETVLSYKVSYN